MRILIDFTQIPVQKSGVGVYALNLISMIHKLDNSNFYFILAQDDDSSIDCIKNMNYRILKVKSRIFRKFFFRAILEQVYIPYLVFKYKIELLHSLHYSFPLFAKTKKVVTIHDMTFFKFPKSHVPLKNYYFKLFIYLATFATDKIITVSRSTRNDFLERFKINESKISVVYHGKTADFHTGIEKRLIETVKFKYGVKKEYFLFIGTIEPRKNLKNLIIAFDKFYKKNKSYLLVISGKKGWYYSEIFDLINKLGLKEIINFTGYIEEKEKPYLISGARIFIYPSIYEGFGIPVIEAMSCGIPTITSNISSLPEVAGEAAFFADPSDPEDICKCMEKLTEDTETYNALVKKSLKQAAKFSWENTATKTINIYKTFEKCL